jgi:predicted transcriptional regulator
VVLIQRSRQSASQVANELGVSQAALSLCMGEAALSASSPNGFRAAEDFKALLPEVEPLRMEWHLLKKAAICALSLEK